MSNITDALDAFRKHQQEINKLLSIPSLKEQQKVLADIRKFTDITNDYNNMLKRVNYSAALIQFKQNYSHISPENTQTLDRLKSISHIQNDFIKNVAITNSDNYSYFMKYIFNKTSAINFNNLFKDITFDHLSVINEILAEDKIKNLKQQEDTTDITNSLTVDKSELVGNMTQAEFRAVIENAIESTHAKKMAPKDRLRGFLWMVIEGVSVDIAKAILKNLFLGLTIYLASIAASNHDYEVAKEISQKISQNEDVKTVKKAFIKNPEIEKPMGELGFLRIESHLRNRPQKQSRLASPELVSKNTVVFPIKKEGNWILVEVETNTDAFIGWIEESKLIKFKLN
ncbi:hypothetical protein ABID52_002221 [Fictibacillus halophilus]|uniref:SH3 domain-containing protein n=1 Tax=Fictibacillus halophilus TaxID=1610490 RepID=A0ABV2LJ68_9BACL|nr:hypothetical protein [Fictibacillus halophilus]